MSEDLLKSFQEAYRNLELLPLLEQKDLDRFRVDYGENGKEESEEGFAIKSQKVLELDEENQEAYDDLIVSIEAKEGALNLLITVCDDADFRDLIITQYEAEPLYLQALELTKRLLGEEHPHVATSLNNLALLYKSQGRYSEAEPLYLQALEIRERGLGANHPRTVTVRKNLEKLLRVKHSSG